MRNVKRNNKKSLIYLGSLLILSTMSVSFMKLYFEYKTNKERINSIEEYYVTDIEVNDLEENPKPLENSNIKKEETPIINKPKINYIGILRIPKISLKQGLVDRKSSLNNIKYNIMIHKNSSSPYDNNGNVILVAHSGTAYVSFFRNLNKLNLNDYIYLDYDNKTFEYKVSKIYEVEKTGQVNIYRNLNKNSITLITCKHGTNKQIVVIGEIV